MKNIRTLLVGMVVGSGLIAGLHPLHAQETATTVQGGAASQNVDSMSDEQVLLQAVESVPPAPAASASRLGTFYSAQHAPGTRLAWPPLPGNSRQLPVWNLGGGVYLLDDLQTGGSMPLMAADGLIPPGGGDGGTNDYESTFTPPVYTTNDLWLGMAGVSNTTAFLTIHEPWTVTNGVYDLFYTTNLSAPETWSWLMRSYAGLTNLAVNNATDAQGFYRLGLTNDPAGNDSLGTNFWIAFYCLDPYSEGGSGNRELRLYISSPAGASGTVTIPGLGITNTFTAAAGAVTNISIPPQAMMYDYDMVENYGIHVVASQPVSVYGLHYEPTNGTDIGYATAAFTGYPTTLLGTNYCLMARPSQSAGHSEFGIVATADNTTVTIMPSPTANLNGQSVTNYSTTNAYTETLQEGQTYQINSADAGYNAEDDVTGTWITSDKPIAVFAGASLAVVPNGETVAANPLVQEQLPADTWGTLALALSFAGRTNGDSYRVLAAYSNTVLTITGIVITITNEAYFGPPWQVTKTNETVVTNLMAGQFCDIIVDGPVEFQASQPIQVAHFANGYSFDHATAPFDGDPCEILLLPTGHYLQTNTVVALPDDNVTGDFNENFLNIIVPQSALTNTLVDGSIVATNNFVAIGTSGYYGARLPVATGTHTVTSSRPVGIEIYGFGTADAYGYFGGWVK